jgi:16S rRNA (guanine527-N7)-methyltransferase
MERKKFIEDLIREAGNCGITINGGKGGSFYVYYCELFKWNKKVNLISIKEEDRFIERHIIDSLSVLLKIDLQKNDRLLDLGSGNGLPGIPLAIMIPEMTVDLLESNFKKCIFLKHITSKLGLGNTSVFRDRFEKIFNRLNNYDYILVRGKRMSKKEREMLRGCLKKKGSLIIYAGVKPYTIAVKPGEKVEYLKGINGRKIIKFSFL